MTKSLEQLMEEFAADGITIGVKLSDPNVDSPARRLRDAAEARGIAHTIDPEPTDERIKP